MRAVAVVRRAALLAAGALLAGALAACGGGGPAAARWAAPLALPAGVPLAADRLAFDSDRTGNFELFTMGTDGSDPAQLTDDALYDSWSPRVSPDRRTLLFYRSPAGTHDRDQSVVSLWAVAADGGTPVELRPAGLDGWEFQGHAEWAPDGSALVMFGGSRLNPQIHVTDPLGQRPRPLIDRGGANLDPVFSPDGRRVAFVGCPGSVCLPSDYEVYVMPSEGGDAVRVTQDQLRDHDPMWSPDGTRLAWLTEFGGAPPGVWDVRIGDGEGRSPRRLFGDDGVTSRPQFAADGSALYVHRIAPGGTRFDVVRVALDGSGAVVLTAGQPGNNEYPSP